jgi:hypothetical protein
MIKTSALRQVCRHALRTQAQRNASTITAIKGREVRAAPAAPLPPSAPPAYIGSRKGLGPPPCRPVPVAWAAPELRVLQTHGCVARP